MYGKMFYCDLDCWNAIAKKEAKWNFKIIAEEKEKVA
jgi:hypothetical protein